MPTPVGHTLLGLSVYIVWCKNITQWLRQWRLILWVIFCSNLPDFDLVPGLFVNDLSRYHQTYTHTLGFALLVWLITFIVLKIKKAENYFSISFLSFLVVYINIILDAFNYDSRPPIGIQLFWPISGAYFNVLPIFYAVPHSYLSDVISSPFIQAVVREVMILSVPFLLLLYIKMKRDYGKG